MADELGARFVEHEDGRQPADVFGLNGFRVGLTGDAECDVSAECQGDDVGTTLDEDCFGRVSETIAAEGRQHGTGLDVEAFAEPVLRVRIVLESVPQLIDRFTRGRAMGNGYALLGKADVAEAPAPEIVLRKRKGATQLVDSQWKLDVSVG